MPDLQAMYRTAHKQLNAAHAIYSKSDPRGLAHEFDSIKLQAFIFQYEMCAELVAFVNNNPQGFARGVSLKGVIHKLYEYNLLSNHLLRRVTALARARGITVSDDEFKSQRNSSRAEFKKLGSWVMVRNKATGHYDKNTALQVELLAAIDPQDVMAVAVAFLTCNMVFLKMLRSVGRRSGT